MVRAFKSRRYDKTEYVAHTGKRNSYKILVVPLGRQPLGRSGRG